jgi:EAL domain-containing protein (putative c-di-GMP-specific phosphodiesterase class I)/GGDEF domain-containing protein
VYLIDFDLIAVILAVLSLYIFYTRKKIPDVRNRRFTYLLWAVLGSSVFGVLSSIAINALPEGKVSQVIITATIFYIFHNAIPFFVAYYILTVSACYSSSHRARVLFFFPWLVTEGLILANLFFKFIFYVDAAGLYRHGPGLYALYTVGVGYLALVLWAIARKKTGFSRIRRLAYLSAVILPLIAIVVQNQLPGLMLECFAASLSVLFALLTIQNSNELIDRYTGLYNREACFQFLQHSFARKKEFWLILIYSRELVNFQGFLNIHTYGQIVRAFTEWLSSIAGKDSLICRLEEGLFALLYERTIHGPPAGEIALALAQHSDEIWEVEGLEVEVPLSIALLRCPYDCADVPDVLDRIDQLIELPEKRENRHIFYAMDFLPDKRRREAAIALALEACLQAGTPELKYQPIYSVIEQRITALEVLVRVSLGGETIQQSEVLRVAERAGLGRRLFDQILARACSIFTAQKLAERGIDQIQIRLLESKCVEIDWPQSILSIGREASMDLSRLCFAVTEPSIVNTTNTLSANMHALVEAGIAFALDDFGSGYTDLGKILEMPLSMIKLDKRIVHAGLRDEKGQCLLAGTVSLFKRRKYPVIAEGIETAEQASKLIAMGCDYLQGFYFGKPISEDKILDLLAPAPGGCGNAGVLRGPYL